MACCFRKCFSFAALFVLAAGCSLPGVARQVPRNAAGFEQRMQEAEYGVVCGEIEVHFLGRVIPELTHFATLVLRKPPELLGRDGGDQQKEVLALTGRGSKYFFHSLPPGQYTPECVKDLATYQLGQTTFYFGPPDMPLSQTNPIEVRRGELTYIGKLVLSLPVNDATIESFVAAVKEKVLISPERAALVKRLGQDTEGPLPPLLKPYTPDGFFYLLFVEEDVARLKAYADSIWGGSRLYQGMRIVSSPIGAPGFRYEDFRSDKAKAGAFNDQGVAAFGKGWHDKALRAYERSIELDPDHPFPYNNRGLLSQEQGRIDEAVADFDRAIQRDGTFGHAFHNRAKARTAVGQYEAALADYEVALKLKGKDGQLLEDRGSLFTALGDMDRACADFRAACDRKVCRSLEDYRNRGVCH